MTGVETYKQNRQKTRPERIVLLLPEEEIAAIDLFGGPSGFRSRNEAIRHLIRRGLDAAISEKSAAVGASTP